MNQILYLCRVQTEAERRGGAKSQKSTKPLVERPEFWYNRAAKGSAIFWKGVI